MNKKKALLFPYDISLLHMITSRDLMVEYEIVSVVSLKSWGYCGEDAGAKVGVSTGMSVSEDFEKEIKKADTLIIADTNIELKCELIDTYIEKAKNMGKLILDERRSAHNSSNAGNELLCRTPEREEIPQIRDICKPIIMIVGTGENTGKFDVQLYAREVFLSQGYKVTQIGSKSCCALWGFHGFPDFMTGNLSGAEKIIRFNHYVNAIANSEDSDIVIIGVPGGVVPISSKMLDDFGLMNYMVANAVKPDYVILNTSYVDYNEQYIETIVNSIKYRLNYEVDSIFLSNYFINWEATDSLDRMVYTTLPAEIINREAEICGCYSVYNSEDVEKFKTKMLETLTGYSSYEAI